MPKPYDKRAIQYDDLAPAARKGLNENMAATGKDVRARTSARIASIPEGASGKAGIERTTLAHIEPHLRDKNVTITSAANVRAKHFKDAVGAAAERGKGAPDGAGWYFDHAKGINASADAHGYDHRTAQVASAVMSPLNSPENERAAAGALMHAHTEGKIAYTPRLHSQLKEAGAPVNDEHVGRMVGASELHPAALAHLSSDALRTGADTNMDLKDIARGGPKGNIEKAIGVLRGNVHPDDAIDPHSSPKVWSYNNATRDAHPGSPEHHEYMARAAHLQDTLSGAVPKGQRMFDYWGKRDSNEGILSDHAHTAEDTWMNSMTAGQADKAVGGGRTVVSKTFGSHALSNVKGATYRDAAGKRAPIAPGAPHAGASATQHAFNNKATQVAAQKIGKEAGVDYHVPAVMVQEVAWTQKRRDTGKDPEFNAGTRARERQAPPAPTEHPGQGKLF